MSRTSTYLSVFFLALAAMLVAGCGEKPPEPTADPEFSAKFVMDYGESSQEYKINLSGPKVRLDMVSPGSGVIIIRKDLGVIWTLMSDNKLFLELPIKPENKSPLVFSPDSITEYERLGEETLDGRTVVKERLVMKNEGGKDKEMYRWFDPVLGWPVRAEGLNGEWKLSFIDIKPGPQEPGLFDIPPDFRMIAARKRQVPGNGKGPH